MWTMRSTCDVSTGLRFFQNLPECRVNKIVEASMPVNPYDDEWVPANGKDDLDIVRASKKSLKAIVSEAL